MLTEIRALLLKHVRPDMQTRIPGLLLARTTSVEHEHTLAEPLLVLMVEGGKRLLLGDEVFEYRAGDYLVVTTDVPVSGHFLASPSLGIGFALRPSSIAPLLLEGGPARPSTALATATAPVELLDAFLRLLRLLDHPEDAAVLAPLIEREILWRLLTGPHGAMIRQIGMADSGLAHINRAITWIRTNYASSMRVEDLASLANMSPSAFHRNFRAVTALSPLQFQKRIRLQEARSLLVGRSTDVAGVGHLVGYDSPTQFNREYRRMFGSPPGRDAARLRAGTPHLP